MDIPQQVKDLINQVVEQDEGGWVLTHNPNDSDGGWTFGGIIAPNWSLEYKDDGSFYHNTIQLREHIEIDLENARVNSVLERKQLWIDRGIEIYYTEFYIPALQIAERTQPIELLLQCELSCIINIGEQHYSDILKIIDKTPGATDEFVWKKTFCKAWMDHYIQLVKKNAEAWRDYAAYIEDLTQGYGNRKKCEKPTTLRAEFLQGWFNRVWRYLP